MIESLIKIVPTVLSVFAKIFFKAKEQQDFKFEEKVFENEQYLKMHDYALSDIFKERRNKNYDASLIRYLLFFPDSMRLFNEYDQGERYLKVSTSRENEKNKVENISLIDLVSDDTTFNKKIKNRTIAYGVLVIFGSIPFIFVPSIDSLTETVVIWGLYMIVCYLGAYYMLDDENALKSAKKISELNQQKENR